MYEYIITSDKKLCKALLNSKDLFRIELRLKDYTKAELDTLMNSMIENDILKKLTRITIYDSSLLDLESYHNLVSLCKQVHALSPTTSIFVNEYFDHYPLKQALQAERKAFNVASHILARTEDNFEKICGTTLIKGLSHDLTSRGGI